MNNLLLRTKLLLIFSCFIGLFVIFSLFNNAAMNKFSNIVVTLHDHPMTVSTASLNALNGIIRIQKSMKELLLMDDVEKMDEIAKSIDKQDKRVQAQLAIVHDKITGTEGHEMIVSVDNQFAAWKPLRDEVIAYAKAGNKKAAMEFSAKRYGTFMVGLEADVVAIHDYVSERGDELYSEAITVRNQNRADNIVFGMLVLLSCIVLSYIFGRSLLKQLGAEPTELTLIASKVSEGDTNVFIDVVTATGVHKAMGEMINALNNAIDHENEIHWIRTGVLGVDNSIRSKEGVQDISDTIITFVSEYASCDLGTLYLEDGTGAYALTAGYSTDPSYPIGTKIEIGEGLAGTVAKTAKARLYQHIPDDYIKISSALGSTAPREIYIVPVLFEERVFGVMELAKMGTFTEFELEFINSVAKNAGMTLKIARTQSKVTELLRQTQNQAQELQQQQEELRVSNEELEEQTKLLKESEKRLQQQQEELRVTNEELEERSVAMERQRDDMKRQNVLLNEAQEDIVKKAKALEEISRYKSEFLANMSHELRTPLNSILILSQLLEKDKNGNLDVKQVEYAGTINKAGNNLLNLINEILDLSKIESGRAELEIEDFDFRTLVDDICAEMKPQTETKKLKLICDIGANLPETVKTDKRKLGQVLKNMLSNAVKFTEKGSVRLSTELNAEAVNLNGVILPALNAMVIKVSDTGVGIPADKTEHIFEAFRQADGSTSRKFGGTGLGLTISKKICELLGGTISVESRMNEGSEFTVILPIKINEQSQTKAPIERVMVTTEQIEEIIPIPVATLRDDSLIGKNTLLIVEDDPNFTMILKDIAESKGFITLLANNGESGLHMADYYKPKAIILDITLPGMDGIKVMERLKANHDTKNIPVHFVSAADMSMQVMHMGAIGFLKKPVTTETLDDVFTKISAKIEKAVKKLLIIEDNEIQRNSIIELIGNGDVVSTAVGTAEEAYRLLVEADFDCVILDLGLEDMDGLQLLNRIKNNSAIAHIPIIIYTGKELTQKEENLLKQYAGSIIIKGARSPERLLAETSLFLHRVEKNLPDSAKRILEIKNSESVLNGKKILITDDDMRNVFALSSVLEENGMVVEIAQNGREAVDKMKGNTSIDLILMDIMMPIMDGYEATTLIRQTDEGRNIPIIALTAKAMQTDRAKCLEAGANEYMSKPVNIDKLLSLLRVWLYK